MSALDAAPRVGSKSTQIHHKGVCSSCAIKNFITEKNPMALLEYRKKSSEAQELYAGATDKFKMIMTATGGSK